MSYYERGSRRLHYQLIFRSDEGRDLETPLVVYMHGLLMDNLSSGYFTFAHQLSAHADVLLYDLCGHGRSKITSSGYHAQDHLDDLKGLIETVEQELKTRRNRPEIPETPLAQRSLFWIGCSYGGVLALKAAQRFSQTLGVALLEGHLGHETFVRQLRADLSSTGAEAEALIGHHFQHWLHRGSGRKRRRLAQRARQLIEESTLLEDLESSPLALDEWLCPESFTYPIYALYGEDSDARAVALDFLRRRQLAGAKDDEVHIFPQCTHALLWEATDAVTRTLECCVQRAKALQLK